VTFLAIYNDIYCIICYFITFVFNLILHPITNCNIHRILFGLAENYPLLPQVRTFNFFTTLNYLAYTNLGYLLNLNNSTQVVWHIFLRFLFLMSSSQSGLFNIGCVAYLWFFHILTYSHTRCGLNHPLNPNCDRKIQ